MARTRRGAGLGRGGAAAWIACAALVAHAAEPSEPRLYSARVEVGYGEPAGPDSVARELQIAVVRLLEHERCLAAVRTQRESDTSDLVLSIVLDGFEDLEEFESSIAERTSPRSDPVDQATRVIAGVAADVHLELRVLAENKVVRARRFHHETSYRPSWSEDPRYEARRRFVESLESEARSFVCKGGPRRLARDVERAQASAR